MSAAARKPEKSKDLVADAARRALDDAKGDVRDASRMLEHAVRQNRRLFDLLVEPLVSNACYDAVRAQSHRERKASWSAPVERLKPTGVTGAHRVVALAAGTLLMFPLPGGKRLGDASREEISEAASFYENQATDMSWKARWMRLVAQSVPADQKAGDVLNERRLRELQTEARRDA